MNLNAAFEKQLLVIILCPIPPTPYNSYCAAYCVPRDFDRVSMHARVIRNHARSGTDKSVKTIWLTSRPYVTLVDRLPAGYAVHTCLYLPTRVRWHEYHRKIYCRYARMHNRTFMETDVRSRYAYSSFYDVSHRSLLVVEEKSFYFIIFHGRFTWGLQYSAWWKKTFAGRWSRSFN